MHAYCIHNVATWYASVLITKILVTPGKLDAICKNATNCIGINAYSVHANVVYLLTARHTGTSSYTASPPPVLVV